MSTTAVILAAGKSTRMNSDVPKPLHEICGKPMLQWILDACYAAGVDKVVLVVGYKKDRLIDAFGADERVSFVEQTEQLGTGHAVKVCDDELSGVEGDVIILAGDTPLIRPSVLHDLVAAHREQNADASMATARLGDPTGYGRIVRDGAGNFERIVEQLDCTPEQKLITEVFPSFYCVKVESLRLALSKLNNDNAKGEYYLTDIFEILRNEGQRVAAEPLATSEDVVAPNTRQQLALADAVMQDRLQDQLRAAGVTVTSATGTYIEAGVTVGRDTVIRPFTFIGRDSQVGERCEIGPFAILPAGSIVADDKRVAGKIEPVRAL